MRTRPVEARETPRSSRDGVILVALACAVAGSEALLHAYLTRPLWYDEVWRAHYLSEPAAHFWSELAKANTPSAAAWVALTRLAGWTLGWHAWVVRLPETATLPLLGCALYLLVRRFAGRVAGVVAGLALGLNGTVLDLGTQLKPYGVEALVTVAVVGLWITGPHPGPGASTGALLARRTFAGLISLFGVPSAFVVLPLAIADTASSPRGHRIRAAAVAAPACGLSVAHTMLFVGHQSGQRHATYWDRQFLAGRGLAGGAAFVWRQLVATAGGAPPGIDRYDGNLVHAFTNHSELATAFVAPAVALLWIVGGRVLARRRDGRVVVMTLLGAELAELLASEVRYWPFGPARVNLFLVPLIVLVTAVGAATLVAAALRRVTRPGPVPLLPVTRWPGGSTGPRLGAAVVGVGVITLAGTIVATSMSGTVTLWHQRSRLRGVDLLVDATTAARRLADPGDVMVVAGRLARPGWVYAMEESVDGPSPRWEYAGWPAPAGTRPAVRAARIRLADTIFVSVLGDGETTGALRARRSPPRGLLVFVFDLDRRGAASEFTELRTDGWCKRIPTWSFPRTGTLTRLIRCRVAAWVRRSAYRARAGARAGARADRAGATARVGDHVAGRAGSASTLPARWTSEPVDAW